VPAKASLSRNHPPSLTLASDGGEGIRVRVHQILTAFRLPSNKPFAIAVSGGSDSVALMHLAADWARTSNRAPPVVLTVDHGLRKQSAKDARRVEREAGRAGLDAHTLTWSGAKPKANIESLAREARYDLMGRWCRGHGVRTLMVAHTLDDQAETFLLRLMRGSGVDGLAAMRARTAYPVPAFTDIELIRPLLSFTRDELRAYLTARGTKWIDDPMNADPRFDRARLRALWPALEAAGLRRERVAAAAAHLARAREALEIRTGEFLTAHATAVGETMLLDANALAEAPREIGLRALAAILQTVGAREYRPRFERLEALYEDMISSRPTPRTLHGCRVGPASKLYRRMGPATLMIVPENPRQTANESAGRPQNRHIPEVDYA
jgi:tRNA(Ile)-lysidine synthase